MTREELEEIVIEAIERNRTLARDNYDLYNLVLRDLLQGKNRIITGKQEEEARKCAARLLNI